MCNLFPYIVFRHVYLLKMSVVRKNETKDGWGGARDAGFIGTFDVVTKSKTQNQYGLILVCLIFWPGYSVKPSIKCD